MLYSRVAFYRSIHGIDLPKLTGIELLNESFRNVGELKLVGMEELERVVIGDDSFMGSNGQFQLKDCPKLKQLTTGSKSFNDYVTCEIQGVDALESIDMGESAFYSASLELKSM